MAPPPADTSSTGRASGPSSPHRVGECPRGLLGLRTDLMWDRLEMLATLDLPTTGEPVREAEPAPPPLIARHPGDEEEFDDEDVDDEEDDLDDEFDDDEEDDEFDDEFNDEHDIDEKIDDEIDDIDIDDEEDDEDLDDDEEDLEEDE